MTIMMLMVMIISLTVCAPCRLLTVTPSWGGLKVLDGGQLEVVIITIVIAIAIVITVIVIIIIRVIILIIVEVGRGEKEEWVIKMVGEQFYLYTIKVIIIMIKVMMIITLMMISGRM